MNLRVYIGPMDEVQNQDGLDFHLKQSMIIQTMLEVTSKKHIHTA